MENVPGSANAPLQARSYESMHRMLDAAEVLLEECSFDELSIQDIVHKAKTSVGVFYARFEDKEGMIAALVERHQDQVIEELQRRREEKFDRLEGLIRHRVRYLIRLYRGKPGLYRALVLRGHEHPDWRYGNEKERGKLSVAQFAESVAQYNDEVGHPKPKQAAQLAFMVVLATLREKILFGDGTASQLRMGDRTLEHELVRLVLRYLEVKA